MDLTAAEDIKKRWQEYTEELYKKDLHNPYHHDGMIMPKNVQTTAQLHSSHMLVK